jgi:hypothetical protein
MGRSAQRQRSQRFEHWARSKRRSAFKGRSTGKASASPRRPSKPPTARRSVVPAGSRCWRSRTRRKVFSGRLPGFAASRRGLRPEGSAGGQEADAPNCGEGSPLPHLTVKPHTPAGFRTQELRSMRIAPSRQFRTRGRILGTWFDERFRAAAALASTSRTRSR